VTIVVAHPAVHAASARNLAAQWRRGPAPIGPLLTSDPAMMARCIELSRSAVANGEYPFATIVAYDGHIIAEAINATIHDADVTRHAEIIALCQAQRVIGREMLRRATLYSNIEPCAMCAYCIREAWVGRVVYALASPVMGGHSKWNILRDEGLSRRLPGVFGAVPEVLSGVLVEEAQQAWREWSPIGWQMIKLRGLLTAPPVQVPGVEVQPGCRRSLWHHLHALFMRRGRSPSPPGGLPMPSGEG
jgi:tRNA(adenine34) deaminase